MPVDRNVVVTFSEPVERNSAQSAFSLRPAGSSTTLTGAFSWNATSTVLTFNPYANLAEATPHTVAVASTAKDVAGNPMAATRTSTFGTSGQGPTVVSFSPAIGTTGVAIDRDVVVTFSEPVERNSAQTALSLRPLGGTTNVGGSTTWNAASTVMTFNPYANLLPRTTYTLDVSPSVKDLTGALSVPFGAGFATDAEAPTVAVSAAAGATGVAVDRDVVVTFSEAVDRNSAQAAFSLRRTGTTTNLGGAFTWDPASRVMTFNPYANLAANTSYTTEIGLSVKDLAGIPMTGRVVSTFVTDGTGPVASVAPVAGATGVPVDRGLVVTFSEPVDRTSAQAAVTLRKAGTTTNLAGAFTWDLASTALTFNPYANLAEATDYDLAVAASAKDVAGNPMTAPLMSIFRTGGQSPTVTGVAPGAGAGGVAVDRDVVVTFSEPVERNSAQAAFSLRMTGATTNLGGAFSWDAASTVMTFNPYSNLLANNGYRVGVAPSAKDAAGTSLAAAFESGFATDAQAPTVSGADPVTGATGVSVNRNVVVTFSEPVERNSAQAALSLRKVGTTVNLGGTFVWNATSTVMTFDPYANLLANSEYSIGVATGVKDVAGNPMAAAFVSSFTTDAQAPTVSGTDPAAGATAVPVERNMVVTFSEPVERNSAQAAFSLRPTGTVVNVAGAFTWNVASTAMTYNPHANLGEATGYTVSVAATVKDIAGNAMAGPFNSAFTTDGRAPTVSGADPATGATGVAVDRNLVVTFSEPMERNSAQAALSLRKAGTTVNLGGYFTWNATSTVMTFDPYANLLSNSGYTVGVATSAKDMAGTLLAATASWSFQTTP